MSYVIYPESVRRDVLAALAADPWSVTAVASAYSISRSTVRLWARQAKLKLPPAIQRQRRGAQQGAANALTALWGDWQKRRARAAALRRKGHSLDEIARRVGYKSPSGASYAARSSEGEGDES
jgi:transposase